MAIFNINVPGLIYCLLRHYRGFLNLQGLRFGDFLLILTDFLKSFITPQGVLSCLFPVYAPRSVLISRGRGEKAVVATWPLSIEPCFRNSRSLGLESMGRYHLCNTEGG